MDDRTSMSYWFPLIKLAGLPVPKTEIVRYTADDDLLDLLDGKEPRGWDDLVDRVLKAAMDVAFGPPAFIRTAHTSGKHEWASCCCLSAFSRLAVGQHIFNLVEASALADIFGLPTDTWVLREMIETDTLFKCNAWEGFPVTREFRVRIGKPGDEDATVFPYWPEAAIEEGDPSEENWRELLASRSRIDDADAAQLASLAFGAQSAVGGGFWSVDLLQGRDGKWWLTDMAEGEKSWWPDV